MRRQVQRALLSEEAAGSLAESSTVQRGARVSSASRFGDAIWDMASMTTLPSAKATSWDFRSVPGFPGGFALGLAEYAFHRVYKPVATHDREGTWLTVYNELVCLRSFSQFCATAGCADFSDVTAEVCEDFLWDMREDGEGRPAKSAERISQIIFTVYRLWEYRAILSAPLPSIPFGRPMDRVLKASPGSDGENKTPSIPEAIYAPLMAAALDYVLDFSGSILRAHERVRDSWYGEIAVTGLSESGKTKRLARKTDEILGEIGSPWRTRPWRGQRDLFAELHQLRRACTITILAYSGIRASELLSLEAGCCVSDELEGGKLRHYINTVLHKHRGVGTKDTWVVIEEVVKAVRILEALTEDLRASSGSGKLFLTPGTNSAYSVTSAPFATTKLVTSATLIYHVNSFVTACNANLHRAPIPVGPEDDRTSDQWRFNIRQFRRTLARYIAREPFGIIAGMLQYKHVEVACFEGYAGSEPSWNKLLAEEKVLASVNVLDEIAMDLSHGAVAGRLGDELRSEFTDEFKGRAEDFPPSQIAKWLADKKKNLFVGKFNFCFFNEEKALCTKQSTRKDAPILNSCDPARCENACVSKRHVPLWKAQLEQAKQIMIHPKASELQRAALREEVAELSRVVDAVMAGALHE